jgi:hypothetical protein
MCTTQKERRYQIAEMLEELTLRIGIETKKKKVAMGLLKTTQL